MLGYQNIHKYTMSFSQTATTELTQEEWKELNTLRLEINHNPAAVSPTRMERFTELFVKSLEGKKDWSLI